MTLNFASRKVTAYALGALALCYIAARILSAL